MTRFLTVRWNLSVWACPSHFLCAAYTLYDSPEAISTPVIVASMNYPQARSHGRNAGALPSFPVGKLGAVQAYKRLGNGRQHCLELL